MARPVLSANASHTVVSLACLQAFRAWAAAPVPRPPHPTSATRIVSPGDAACANRAIGKALSNVPPATAVDLRKLRRVTIASVLDLVFMVVMNEGVVGCVDFLTPSDLQHSQGSGDGD